MANSSPAIDVSSLKTRLGGKELHTDVSFTVTPGTIAALIGGSGSGKSVLLKEIIGLIRPTSGTLSVLGRTIWSIPKRELDQVRNRFGVMFQNGALFSALNVSENVSAPLTEQADVDPRLLPSIVNLRLLLAGLSPDAGRKQPAQLSGGMTKRAALARALALEPELLFLDEPTSGLDPINARSFDSLIRTLSQGLGITVFLVTHDLDTLAGVTDQIIVLNNGKVVADGSYEEVSKSADPWIQSYFSARAFH